jgi:predicted transposase/invertase (TIGR01784 family)
MIYETEGRYINPYTDYGFKYLFGTEPNKEFTLGLLNALLQGREVIKSLTLLPSEQLGDTQDDRRAVFDVYCENEKGDRVIIEMQKADQQYFKDRSIYYSSFPIRQQGVKGRWRFGLKAVYTIGILDFVFDEDKDDEEYYHHVVQLMDVQKKEVFYDNLTYIYLEMPKFQKREDELESLFDKWLYALKNLPRLLERPAALQERIFKKFFDVAEVAALSKDDYNKYLESEKIYYDLDGAFRTASRKGFLHGQAKGLAKGIAQGRAEGRAEGLAEGRAEGRAEGKAEGKAEGLAEGLKKGKAEGLAEGKAQGLAEGEEKANRENALRMKSDGLPLETIAKYTGLSVEQIEQL